MDQKYGEFIGVDNLYIAEITEDSDDAYEADTPEYLAPVAEIGGTPEVSNITTYYDNKAANNYVTEGKTELKIVVANLPAEMMAMILGKDFNAGNGRVYDSGEPDPPDLALGFRYNMGKSGYRYYWYYKGNFSGGVEEAITKKESLEIKTYTLTFTAMSTQYLFEVEYDDKALKRVYADTAETAFDETGWFEQVQTPESVGAPSV